MKFKFIFEEPLLIVPADKLRINLEFSEFEEGFKKDEEIIIQRQMSKQLPIGGAGNIE